MPIPTARLLVLALGGAGILLLGTRIEAALVLFPLYLAGLVLVALFDLWRGPRAGDFNVRRAFEPRFSIGASNPVELTVARLAGSASSARMRVRDEPPAEIPGTTTMLSGTLAPEGVWTGRYQLHPVRRGAYHFGRMHLRVETPLRLFQRQFSYDQTMLVKVYPNLREVQRHRLLVRQGRLTEAGMQRAAQLGGGTDFRQLRDYQPDDDFRRIAWKATARRHVPVTVDHEPERAQNVIIALDTGRLMGATVGALEKLDHAINAALLLAQVAIEMGDRPGLIVFADRVQSYLPPKRGPAQFQRILERLYALEVQPVEPDHAAVLRYVTRKESRRALVVVFTDHAETADAKRLGLEFRLLARRHLPVYVTLRDPDIHALADVAPDDSQALYEKVVARRLLDERHVLLEHLQHASVQVLDTTAEQLTPTLINRYLDIKQRGRL